MSTYRKIKDKQSRSGARLTLLVEGDSSLPVIIEDCKNCRIEGVEVVGWRGSGDVVKGADNAIRFINCHNVVLVNPLISGSPDEETKEAWRNSVANGLRVDDGCTGILIEKPSVSFVHFGCDIRGETYIIGGDINHVSADHILCRSDDCRFEGIKLSNSLDVLSYELIHRDKIQLIAGKSGTLKNVTVKNNKLSTGTAHKWSADSQDITFTDGKGENIQITENDIDTEGDLAILLNPCTSSEITKNTILSDNNPVVSCEDRKRTGYPIDIMIAGNETKKRTEEQSFSAWIDSLKNLNAPAVTERDIKAAAEKLGISAAMVAAVSTVESRGEGYNSDGSTRSLLERHQVYKYSKIEACLTEMTDKAGVGVCSQELGGYVGGVAEYDRIKRVGEVNRYVALMSASFGRWQIMGFNHKLVGYDSPEEMYKAFQSGEKAQLDAFVEFIIANGLAKHLQEAERLAGAGKSPLKPLDAFANAYNGRSHNRYDLKIAAAYEAEKRKRNGYQVKPIQESTTLQGGATATVGTIGATILTGKEILSSLKETRELAEGVTNDLTAEVDALKDKIAEPNYILWAIIAFLVLAQFGVFTSVIARIKDRLRGLNL